MFFKDSPGQWTCDHCGITRCWATRSTCYRCGEARGHTDDLQRHHGNMAREARERGTSSSSVPVSSPSSSPPWAVKAPPSRSVPPRVSSTAPWAPSKPLLEVDKIHDSGRTALLRAALALFEKCDLPLGVLDEIRRKNKSFVSVNLRLSQARKLAAEKQQKVMEQATVVSDLKLQLVELRQDIANNPTPEVSEDEEGEATPLGVPLVPHPAVTPAVPPEKHSFGSRG